MHFHATEQAAIAHAPLAMHRHPGSLRILHDLLSDADDRPTVGLSAMACVRGRRGPPKSRARRRMSYSHERIAACNTALAAETAWPHGSCMAASSRRPAGVVAQGDSRRWRILAPPTPYNANYTRPRPCRSAGVSPEVIAR